MPSRRDALALLAASLAGCSADIDSEATDGVEEPPLTDRTLAVVGDVAFPGEAAGTLVDTVAAADAVVLPPEETHYDTALYTLERGTPVVVAGDDAPGHLGRICDRSGYRYGLPSQGWTAGERVAAAVPASDRLDVQYLDLSGDTDLADGLPGAVGAVLDGRPPAFSIADPPRPDGGVELGRVRVRGRVDVGGYDRWDRVTLLPDRTRAVVETVASVGAADASSPNGFGVDGVRIRTEFEDASVESTGPASSTDAYAVEEAVGEERTGVDHAFTPESAAARRSLTVGVRTVVSFADVAPPFAYVGNVRFRWRRSRLLRDDESWVAHTPGRAVWRRF